MLKAQFLIRYVAEVIKPTVDNLATLCLDQIDADKLALKRRIQASLERLEGQRLVSRNGDQWFFLTNEERDVAREIGRVDISAAEKSRLLGELVFEEVLAGQTKVRYRPNIGDTKGDYEFNRLLDGVPFKQAAHALTLELLTPLGDEFELSNESRCIMRSAEGNGRALIRLVEGDRLDVELTLYRQIEKYIDSPKAVAALSSIPQIMYLQDQASDRIDEAMDAIAAAMPKPVLKVAEPTKTAPGAATGSLPAVLVPLSTGHLTGTAPKPSVTVDAAAVSLKTYPWCRLASVSVSSEIVAVSCHC